MICLSKNGKDEFINAFARGSNSPIVEDVAYDNPSPIIFRSIVKKDLIEYRWKHNLPFYYMDSGYFGNYKSTKNPSGKKLWVRIVKNGLQHNNVISRSSDRFDKFNMQVHKQKRNGKHILLVLPSDKPCKFYNIDLKTWTTDTVNKIRQYTDREIRIREKPMHRSDRLQNTIFEDLEGAHATVTLQSIAAVESVLSGIAAFTLAPTAADPVCDKDLSKIESPTIHHIEKLRGWANHLAYGQFHFTELVSGQAYRMLIKNEST